MQIIIYFFATPSRITTEAGTAKKKKVGGLTTNRELPGPIIMIDQSEILSSSQITFIHSRRVAVPFTSHHRKRCN
jgi:hypothetical protein